MSKTYRLAPLAQADVEDIFRYVADDDLEAALRVDQEIDEACLMLASRPLMGHTREDLKLGPEYRVWPIYSYLIIYRPDSDPLEVVRVWHGAQKFPSL
jgi:plasmid stabilization system protein ParE